MWTSEEAEESVIIKYAGHAGHVRHDFEMSGRVLKHSRTFCPAVVNVEQMSGRENKGCWTFSGSKMSSRESKCPAEHQMSAGTPNLILIITAEEYKELFILRRSVLS